MKLLNFTFIMLIFKLFGLIIKMTNRSIVSALILDLIQLKFTVY